MALVVVSGAPGSGKSTLARPLAEVLGFSLIGKDTIKEALADELGTGDAEWKRTLSGASFAVVAALLPGLRDCVIEGNVYPGSTAHRLLASDPSAVEVHCRCPLELCRDRFRARTDRHAVHVYADPTIEFLRQFERPLGLATVVEVDTSEPVDATTVAEQVRAAIPG